MTAPGDAERFFEIVNEERRPIPPPGVLAGRTASHLAGELANFAKIHHLGEAIAYGLFRLRPVGNRCRMPDVAFVSYQRWPAGSPMSYTDEWWDVVPDLVGEVVTPEERADDLMAKIADYFQAGTRLVWLVYPRLQLVYAYESLTQARILSASDELDGGAVLPGFRLSVAALFPEMAPPA
jgi:Uma2 family endonuclease